MAVLIKITKATFKRYWFSYIPECQCVKIQPKHFIITIYYSNLKNIIMKILALISFLILFLSASCQEPVKTLVYVTVSDYDSVSKLLLESNMKIDSLQGLLDIERSFVVVPRVPDSIRADTFHTTIYNENLSIYVNMFNDRGVVRVNDKTKPIRFYLDYTDVNQYDFWIADSTDIIYNPVLRLDKITNY